MKDADPVAMYLNDVFTVTVNLAGLPGVALPTGQSSTGLPLGLQLIGRPWEEADLLSSAYALEKAAGFVAKPRNGGKPQSGEQEARAGQMITRTLLAMTVAVCSLQPAIPDPEHQHRARCRLCDSSFEAEQRARDAALAGDGSYMPAASEGP